MAVSEKFRSLEKVPPQALEAEIAVLGSMLLDEQAVSRALEILKPAYLYSDAHRRIFSAMTRLFDRSQAIDLITITEELKKGNELEGVGGATYLSSLLNAVPSAANIEHYAQLVKQKALVRSLITASSQILEESYESGVEVDELLDHAEQLVFNIGQEKIEGQTFSIKDIIKDSIETIDHLYQRKEHVTGLATGFHDFDILTSGLHKSDLIIVAARPSMGKSAFATCLCEHIGVQLKKPVAFFSLEMSKEQLVQRMLCSHARVDAHKVRTGFLSHSDWPRLTSAAGKLSEAPIYIDDFPGVTVLELRAKARRMKAQFGIELIVVDYLQLMQSGNRAENRQQEISEISRRLKALARELSVPVIAISQLSRAVESRTDHRPQLSDLRESGAIEQDADLVILLLREEYYNPTEDNRGKAEVMIAKQRNGPVGSVQLAFLKEYARFDNLSFRETSS
jgi:replicative DNA helicase